MTGQRNHGHSNYLTNQPTDGKERWRCAWNESFLSLLRVYHESVPAQALFHCQTFLQLWSKKVDTFNVTRQKIQNDKLSGVKVVQQHLPQPASLIPSGEMKQLKCTMSPPTIGNQDKKGE